MKPFARHFGALMLLPVTAGLMFASTVPSIADEPSCKAVVIGIGLGCSEPKPVPSPTQSSEPKPEPAPIKSEPEKPRPEEPVVAPVPEATKDPVLVKPPVVQPAPVATVAPSPEAVITIPSSTPSPTAELVLPVNGEQASEKTATPDFLRQAGEAGPYIFFVSLAVLIAMIITAKVKNLFPFESGTHRAEK